MGPKGSKFKVATDFYAKQSTKNVQTSKIQRGYILKTALRSEHTQTQEDCFNFLGSKVVKLKLTKIKQLQFVSRP